MKAFLVSDNHDTLAGLRLAGIPGVIAHGPEETEQALRKALEDETLGLLVLTERAAQAVPNRVAALRQSGELPLVVEIPDRHGSRRPADFLTRYVREAIGVKME